jgi:hypothetical protein
MAVGLVGGVAAGLISLALLRRQVAALTARRGGMALIISGLVLRLALIGGGLAAALLWGLWCGLAYAGALIVTRQVSLWRVKGKP